MVHAVSIWLLAAAFLGAGLFNAIGTSTTQSDFARWGYPAWWNVLTGWPGDRDRRSDRASPDPLCRPDAWGGHHCGWDRDRSAPPRFWAPRAARRLRRSDRSCSNLGLSPICRPTSQFPRCTAMIAAARRGISSRGRPCPPWWRRARRAAALGRSWCRARSGVRARRQARHRSGSRSPRSRSRS